jgi:hypothetical protein
MTEPGKFRNKPVVIEAMQFDGFNKQAITEWAESVKDGGGGVYWNYLCKEMIISTLKGDVVANPGDYIIKGIKGEFYPCDPDIFEATYEEVSDE